MTKIIFTLLVAYSTLASGQDKYNLASFNKLTEIELTDYVIASIENKGKTKINNEFLVFINTKNGKTEKVDLPEDSRIIKIEQINIPELSVNKILLVAQTVDLNNKNGIEWSDPQQVFILSTDGKEKRQLTEDAFFVRKWVINKKTGTITIAADIDSNSNRKSDKNDENKIVIYDLSTLELKHQL